MTRFHFHRRLFVSIARVLLMISVLGQAAESRASTGAFTYQGRLTDTGTPANGIFDMRFTLYDSATGGSAGTRVVTNASTLVTNGVFSALLDFGTGVFDGTDFWIEIGVRTNGSVNDYATLSPRQKLTAAPYAAFAQNANAANLAGTVPDNALSLNVPRLDSENYFTGANYYLNSTNVFEGTFLGDGSGLTNVHVDFSGLTLTVGLTNPDVTGIISYHPEIVSITEDQTNDVWKAPAGWIQRSLTKSTDAFGQTNWCVVGRSGTTQNYVWTLPVNPTGWPTVTSTEFLFNFDGRTLGVLLWGNGGYLGVVVDGADDFTRILTPPDSQFHTYTVDFGTSARRQIGLLLTAYRFGGVQFPATNCVSPPILPKPARLIVVGDSFAEENDSASWPTKLESLFYNLDVWSSSVGTTGYLNPGTPGRVNARDRIMNDVVNYQPDYVLFAVGINDNSITTNQAAETDLYNACLACYQTIQTNLPGCRIIALGPFWPRTPDTPSIFMVNEAISNACMTAGISSNYVDTLSDPWVTGVWNQPGSGTAVNYTSGDSTHPTGAGHWNIACRVAAELARRFPELHSREKLH
jgi:hypothetical protein